MPGRRKRATSPTGQVVEFTWYDEEEPTDADLDEIFAEAARNEALTEVGAPPPTIPDTAPTTPSAIPAPPDPRSAPARLLRGAARSVGEAAIGAGQVLGQAGSPLRGGALSPADQAIFDTLREALPAVEGVAGNIGYYGMAMAPSFMVGKLPLVGEAALNAAQAAGMGGNPAVAGVTGAALSRLRLPTGKWSPRGLLERSAERNLEKGVLGGGGKEWVKERFKVRRPELFEARWLRGSHAEQAEKAAARTKVAGKHVEAMRQKYGADVLSNQDYTTLLTHLDDQIANRAGDVTPQYLAEFQKLRQAWVDKGMLRRSQGQPVTIDDLYEFVHGRPINVADPMSKRVGGLDALVKWERSRDATEQLTGQVARVARQKFVEIMVKGKPDFEQANKVFSLMADIRAMTKQTAKRKTGQIGLIPKMAAAGAGFGAATLAGENKESAGLTAILGASAVMFLQSPRYQMVAAGLKHRLAHALANGQHDQARRVLDRMMAQTAAQATTGAQ